jgi:hypothetical protein
MSKYGYPSHLIPNSEKNRDWILAYVKAAYKEFNGMNGKIFYGARYTYATIRDYAMGTQSISKYKRMLDVSESENDSWLNIDWSVLPVVSRFRRLALAKLSKRSYNITATPIDIMSQQEVQGYRAKQEVKIRMRSELQSMNSPLAQENVFKMEDGAPRDMEELQIHMDFSYKHKLGEEIEEVIKNVLNINDYDEIRNKLLEDSFDFGVCGVKEYVLDGVVRLRHVRPENVITSYCMNRDFSDAQHVGELRMMSLSDIRRQAQEEFTEEQYYDIAEKFVNSFQNPSAMPPKRGVGSDYDSFQIPVLDLEFISINSMDIESRIDKRGNQIKRVFSKNRKRKANDYTTTHYKVIYKVKFIVGTEYLFDYGLCTNMKRERANMTETSMSYHLFAPEFYDMRASSIMEQVIPIADSIQLNWFKLQNAIAIARPKGIQIALDAIENIPLGSGGAELTPKEVLDLFNKKGTLVYRYLDPSGNPSPYKPIEEIENGLGRDVTTYYDLITRNMQMLRDITGLNEYVDGSTIDPRTLSNVTRLAEEASNNALFACVQADRMILERVAKSVIVRIQDLIKFKTYHPSYKTALGVETIDYLSGGVDFSYREFGIKIEDKPDIVEREKLKNMAGQYIAAGLIEFEDFVLIENSDNLKKAQYILAYRLKKRKEEKLRESMLLQQQNAAVQQQSVAAKGEADIARIEAELGMKMELEKLKGEIKAQLEQLKSQLASTGMSKQ